MNGPVLAVANEGIDLKQVLLIELYTTHKYFAMSETSLLQRMCDFLSSFQF